MKQDKKKIERVCDNCVFWNRKGRGDCYNTSNKNYAACKNEHFVYCNLDKNDTNTDLLIYADYECRHMWVSCEDNFGNYWVQCRLCNLRKSDKDDAPKPTTKLGDKE